MHFLVRKLYDLVFDRRTVARPDRLNLPAIHRRAMNIVANDAVSLWRCPRDVARNLRVVMRHTLGSKTERSRIDVAGLLRETRPVDGASIKARRRARLKPASA